MARAAAALIFGPVRTLQWAAYFLFLEQPDRYPPDKLGRMIGYGNVVNALIGDAPPTGLKAYVDSPSAWPSSELVRYQVVHGALSIVLVACLYLPVYVFRDIRRRTAPCVRPVDPSSTPPPTERRAMTTSPGVATSLRAQI